jgi:hypothetical protein
MGAYLGTCTPIRSLLLGVTMAAFALGACTSTHDYDVAGFYPPAYYAPGYYPPGYYPPGYYPPSYYYGYNGPYGRGYYDSPWYDHDDWWYDDDRPPRHDPDGHGRPGTGPGPRPGGPGADGPGKTRSYGIARPDDERRGRAKGFGADERGSYRKAPSPGCVPPKSCR